ncbi:MAG: transcription elongation factor GreA [Nocardioides sp.]
MSESTAHNPEQDVIWLTQDAHDKLTEELEHLRGPARADVIARISAARDEGDLKENGGYHAAKEEQGKLEMRIRQIEEMLRKAQVGAAADDGTVSPGFVVTYRFEGDDDTETFLLGAREIEADDLPVFSPQSPLGSAIIGAREGDTVAYVAPNGKTLRVQIVSAKPYTG